MSNKTKIRLLGGACGAAIVTTALFLQDEFALPEGEVQIAIWSSMILVMVLLANRNHLRKGWFRRGFVIVGALHAGIVFACRRCMPFSNLGVVILIGVLESISLQKALVLYQRRVLN
jgi:hypothetical protein